MVMNTLLLPPCLALVFTPASFVGSLRGLVCCGFFCASDSSSASLPPPCVLALEVGKCKTLRRVGLDEIFEVLEGPRSDEKLGLTRIRGRSLNDGVVGWISVSGNKGTPFLKEVRQGVRSVTIASEQV